MLVFIQGCRVANSLRLCPFPRGPPRLLRPQDTVPDEAFSRLRGTLFFGPAFRVTRNKLLFRDNLPEVLAAAVPGTAGRQEQRCRVITHSQPASQP